MYAEGVEEGKERRLGKLDVMRFAFDPRNEKLTPDEVGGAQAAIL